LLEDALGLVAYIPKAFLNRFNGVDANLPTHYASIADIVDDYYGLRMDVYELRLAHKEAIIQAELHRLRNRVRFIEEVVSNGMKLSDYGSPRLWWADLERKGYLHDKHPLMQAPPRQTVSEIPTLSNAKFAAADSDADDADAKAEKGGATGRKLKLRTGDDAGEDGDDEDDSYTGVTFRYLTRTSMDAGTGTLLEKLRREVAKAEAALAGLGTLTPGQLWLQELDVLEKTYMQGFRAQRIYANDIETVAGAGAGAAGGHASSGKRGGAAAPKKKRAKQA
jgi:hypothetical protein